jgi:hypothetical protein
MTFQIAPDGPSLNDANAFARFHMNFMERIRALPGVQSVGVVENVPLNEGTALAPFRTEEMSTDPDAGKRLRYTFAAGDFQYDGDPGAGWPLIRESGPAGDPRDRDDQSFGG